METGKWVAVLVIVAIVAGVIGYVVKPTPTPPEVAELQDRVSELETTVSEQSARISELEAMPKAKTIKAGFVYVGPIEDKGWTMAHNRGRTRVDEKYDWLTTTYAEIVPEAEVSDYIDEMFEANCDVVFTTSFGYGWDTVIAGARWPDKILYHCSGDPIIMGGAPNVGFYFADFYQIYYMNGLAAGALTKTNKIGYVASFDTSEVVRHLDAFYLGAKEINPNVEMKVLVTGAWVDPATDSLNAETLIAWGADVIGFTADAPAVISKCQEHYEETGEKIYTFSHYSSMKEFGPDVVVSGQLVNWEKWYEYLLLKAQQGEAENWQHWGLINGGYVEMGSDFGEPINPIFIDDLKAATVTDPVLGTTNVYDLIMHRYEQFKDVRSTFEPFTGPIYDTEGNLKLKPGEAIDGYELWWEMDWYPEGIIPPE
jgi:simple sugar transport system substrate-binding protein